MMDFQLPHHDELLGGHTELVGRLLERFNALTNAESSQGLPAQLIILEGSSGTGKTRVIREFYRRLREEKQDPYWPPLPQLALTTGAGIDAMAERKRVTPALQGFIWPENALPTFGWWGFQCQRQNLGTAFDNVSALQDQLHSHHLPLTLAHYRAVKGPAAADKLTSVVLDRFREALINEFKGSSAKEINKLVITHLGIEIPYLGTLIDWGIKGYQGTTRILHQQAQLRRSVDLGEHIASARNAKTKAASNLIRSVAHRKLPTILAIEDIHWMSSELGDLVDYLMLNEDAPILVIATAWPERNKSSDFSRWLSKLSEKNQVEMWRVPALSADQLSTMVRWYAPNTSQDQIERILTNITTPHFLKIWMTSRLVRECIEEANGAIILEDSQIDLPHEINEVYRSRWKELPEESRLALMNAAAANPLEDSLGHFIPSVIEEVAFRHQETPKENIDVGIRQAIDPAYWCLRKQDVVHFSENSLIDLARSEGQRTIGRKKILPLTAEVLKEWILDNVEEDVALPMSPAALTASSWFLHLEKRNSVSSQPPGTQSDERKAWILAHDLMARHGTERYNFDQVIEHRLEIHDLIMLSFEKSHPKTIQAKQALASAYFDAGNYSMARKYWNDVLEIIKSNRSTTEEQAIQAKLDVAIAMKSEGRYSDAISLLDETWKVIDPQADSKDETVLHLRSELGALHGRLGNNPEALSHFEYVLQARKNELASDDEKVLSALNDLAHQLNKQGKHQEALKKYKWVLKIRTGTLDPMSAEILRSRNNVAATLNKLKDYEAAADQYLQVLNARIDKLGKSHPDTLLSAHNYVVALNNLKRAGITDTSAEALQQISETVNLRSKVIGSKHPKTLNSRYRLAETLALANRPSEAREILREILPFQQDMLKPDHPEVERTLRLMAECDLSIPHQDCAEMRPHEIGEP